MQGIQKLAFLFMEFGNKVARVSSTVRIHISFNTNIYLQMSIEFLQKDQAVADQIERDLYNKCGIRPGAYFDADEETDEASLHNQAECVVNSLGKASDANGLSDEWKKYKPQFNKHLQAMKQCEQTRDKIQKILYVSSVRPYVKLKI